MKPGIKLRQKLTIKPKLRLITRIRLATVLELPEKKFSEYVVELEKDPLFEKLLSRENAENRVITCKSFYKVVFELSNMSISEHVSGDGTPVDVEPLLLEKSGTVELIKKIGLEKFEKYFIRPEEHCSPAEISKACGVSKADIENINALIDDLSIRSEFYHPSGLELESRVNYTKVAQIEYDGKDDFLINFFLPRYVSGRYVINNGRLNALKKQGVFCRQELADINKLIEKIELINARKSTVYQIIRKLVEVQKNYFYSGEDKFLVPYTQKRLSRDIGIDNSVICRAIYGRSITTPHGVEKPIKFFFPSNKDIRMNLIKKIIDSESGGKLTDSNIVLILMNRFNIAISRRSVNVCRNEAITRKRS